MNMKWIVIAVMCAGVAAGADTGVIQYDVGSGVVSPLNLTWAGTNTWSGPNSFSVSPTVPLASETNHAVPYGQLEDLLSDLAVMTLYGATNLGTVFTSYGTLLDDRPTNDQQVAIALDVGTNAVGMFMYETPVDGSISAQNMIGRFWYSKDTGTTVGAYMELITICTNAATTNVIGTSAMVLLAAEDDIASERLTVNIPESVECDGMFLGVRFYLIRTGNPAVTVTTYMGTPYDTHLEGQGLGGISGYVPSTRTVTINGVAGALESNVTYTVGDVRTDQSNVFAGGTVQSCDGLTVTNATLRGTLTTGGNWISGAGGSSGLNVAANDSVTIADGNGWYQTVLNGQTVVMTSNTNRIFTGGQMALRIGGGTLASPTAASNNYGNALMLLQLHDGTTWRNGAYIYGISTANCSASNTPADLVFYTNPGGETISAAERMRVKANGAVKLSGGNSFPTGAAGDIYYHTVSNKHFGHNGSTWNALY